MKALWLVCLLCSCSQDRHLYRLEQREYRAMIAEHHDLSNYNYHLDLFERYERERAILEGVYK